MARYKKKRARELKHDRFRDTTMGVVDRLGNLLEGKGRSILYGLLGLIVVAALVGLWLTWSRRKADEARRARSGQLPGLPEPVSATPAYSRSPTYQLQGVRNAIGNSIRS